MDIFTKTYLKIISEQSGWKPVVESPLNDIIEAYPQLKDIASAYANPDDLDEDTINKILDALKNDTTALPYNFAVWIAQKDGISSDLAERLASYDTEAPWTIKTTLLQYAQLTEDQFREYMNLNGNIGWDSSLYKQYLNAAKNPHIPMSVLSDIVNFCDNEIDDESKDSDYPYEIEDEIQNMIDSYDEKVPEDIIATLNRF